MLQPPADFDSRRRYQAQLLQLSPKLVNTSDPSFIKWLQNVFLERLDLVRELLDNDKVVVDDKVYQGVEDVVLAMDQLLGRRLGALPHPGVGSRGTVADRYDVAATDKDLGLTQRDVPIDQEGSAQYQEGGVAVGLKLGPLVCVERVLERKLV
jgi:hypothetical protein